MNTLHAGLHVCGPQDPLIIVYLMCLSKLWLHTSSRTPLGCLHSNSEVRGRESSPCPLSRNSVMIAALQGDQGLVRLIWISVGDIMWLSCNFPNTSSHAFTLSCGMLKTWPARTDGYIQPRLSSCASSIWDVTAVMGCRPLTGLTKLMSSGEGWRQTVVLDHGAAPLGVTHGADVRHAKSVTGRRAAQILGRDCVYTNARVTWSSLL